MSLRVRLLIIAITTLALSLLVTLNKRSHALLSSLAGILYTSLEIGGAVLRLDLEV
jgi:hypothetical protein